MAYEDKLVIHRTDRCEIPAMDQVSKLKKPLAGDVPLSAIIDRLTQEGDLYERLDDQAVHCYACEHNCKIKNGARGICQVRYNLDGKLMVPWGYVGALQCDPVEKKPFFHLLPGTDALTFGMLGCDLHCSYCQNWDISQSLRDAKAGRPPAQVTPERLVALAQQTGASCLVSSYNEPLITSEWSQAVFKLAKAHGLKCLYVSNGNATQQVLEYIRPQTDAYKIDLKTMRDPSYRKLGTTLDRILNGIRMVHRFGFWLEIVTLLIPGFNDSDEELRDMAEFIKSVSASIPWHVTAFHKDYRMQAPENTTPQTLIRATEIGYACGLHFVYPGNLPGKVGPYEHTYCPTCKSCLIERLGYVVLSYKLNDHGECPKCQTSIPGVWPTDPNLVKIGTSKDLFQRVPKAFKL